MRAMSKTVEAVCWSTVRRSGTRPDVRANASRAVVSQASIDVSLRDSQVRRPAPAAPASHSQEVCRARPSVSTEGMSVAAHSEGVTGVLLVGGGSRRFGSPKALARVGEKTFADIAWERLAWCDERMACGKLVDGLPLRFPVRDDDSPVRAPLAGVVAGLRAARFDVIVALPVDLPFVTDEALQTLASACSGDAAVPQTGPLPGAYRRSALPVLEQRLRARELGLASALERFETRVVEVDPRLLANINRPEDLPWPALGLFSPSRDIVFDDG
jgi:molybdopterin-guanine dinucleotide biosynthesis protein A